MSRPTKVKRYRSYIGEHGSLLPPALESTGQSSIDEPEGIVNSGGSEAVQRQVWTSSGSKPVVNETGHIAANQSITALRRVFVTFALGCLVFIVATNMSMLTTTQSAIASELDAFEQTSWFTSAYLITMSSLGPVNGKLSAVFSPRICICFAAMIMAIGAIMCAWATTLEAFIAGRAVGGIGASGIFTVAIIIVLELSGSKRKGLVLGLLNSGYTAGVAVGATAAGALLDIIGWRALFWLQAPIIVPCGFIILLSIPADFTAGKKDIEEADRTTWERVRRIDYLGAATLTASLVLLLYALSSPTKIPLLPIILSIIVGAVFVLTEIYLAYDPVIPVSLLKSRGLLFTCLGTLGYMMGRWSVLFYTPTYAIAVRQWSKAVGGSLLIPTNLGFATGSVLLGWLHIRRQGSFYLSVLLSYAIFPVTLFLLAILSHREGSPVAFVIVLFASGCATGAAVNYSLVHLLHVTPTDTHYVATALIMTFRGFAGCFGSAIGGGLFTRALATSLETQFAHLGMQRDALVRKLLGSPVLVGQLTGVEREVAKQGYEDGIKTLWLSAALLAFAMVFVQAGVGWKGHAEKWAAEDDERRALLYQDESRDRAETVAESL